MRIRIRIADTAAAPFKALRPSLRGMAVAMILEAHAAGIDLAELLAVRRELIKLGTLLNHSLKVSGGKEPDLQAAQRAAEIIARITAK